LRRAAAARRDRTRNRDAPERRPRRRAHREPRLGERVGAARAPRAATRGRHHDRPGHALARSWRARVEDRAGRGWPRRGRRRARLRRMSTTLENFQLAFAALRANWLRAVLTALGIVIGVGSLIAVTAVSAGAQKQVAESIRRLGSNVVLVDGEFITIGTSQTATDRTITSQDVGASTHLPTGTEIAPQHDLA